MKTMNSNSSQAEAIRRRMEEVRQDLDEDVQEIVEGARDMGKWRSYVRSYPWVCLGAALAAGYLIVPRRPLFETLAKVVSQGRTLLLSNLPPQENVRDVLLPFVGNLVLRGITSYLDHQASQLIAPRNNAANRGANHDQSSHG